MEDAGAAALAVHGRTAAQSYSGSSDWDADRSRCAGPSGFRCSAAATASSRRSSWRSCWTAGCPACWSAAARCATRGSSSRPRRSPAARRRARSRSKSAGSSCSTTSSCCCTSAPVKPRASGTSRRPAPRRPRRGPARGHDRWVINKLRALNSWYTKGLDNGSHLRVVGQRRRIDPPPARDHRRVLFRDRRGEVGLPTWPSRATRTERPAKRRARACRGVRGRSPSDN